MTTHSAQAFLALSAVVFLALGCEKSSDNESGVWQQSSPNTQQTAPAAQTTTSVSKPAAAAQPAAGNGSQASGTSTQAATRSASVASSTTSGSGTDSGADDVSDVAPDQIAYGALSWRYGGIGGGGYKPSGVSISGLRANKGGLSFKYNTNLSAWGHGHGDINAYACMFVQTSSGSWVGGKFDWISSSRSSRDFNNVYSGYGGWNLDNVPNPCPIAFVILDANSKRRSNVIVGTWNR